MSRIDKVLKEIKDNKGLSYHSYVFYNKVLSNDRELYDNYKTIVEEEKRNHLLDYADKYISDTSEYFKTFVGRDTILKNRKAIEADDKEKCKELSRILGELYVALDNSGMIDVLVNRHNELCTKNNVEVMQVKRDDVEPEFNVAVNSRSKLIYVNLKNAFWLNKYIKLLDSIQTQQIYEKNLIGFDMNNLKENELDYLLYMSSKKYELLKIIYLEGLSTKDERIEKKTCRMYEGEYQEIFSSIFPGAKHDIFDDYEEVKEFERVKDILYEKKNMFMTYTFMSQFIENKFNKLNPTIKQWGVESKAENNFLVMGLEPEGYMLPATFHVPTYIYREILKAMDVKQLEVPEFFVPQRIDKDSRFSTNVLVKPSAEQAKQIRLEAKKRGRQQELLKRVNEQINGRPHSYGPTQTVMLDIREEN